MRERRPNPKTCNTDRDKGPDDSEINEIESEINEIEVVETIAPIFFYSEEDAMTYAGVSETQLLVDINGETYLRARIDEAIDSGNTGDLKNIMLMNKNKNGAPIPAKNYRNQEENLTYNKVLADMLDPDNSLRFLERESSASKEEKNQSKSYRLIQMKLPSYRDPSDEYNYEHEKAKAGLRSTFKAPEPERITVLFPGGYNHEELCDIMWHYLAPPNIAARRLIEMYYLSQIAYANDLRKILVTQDDQLNNSEKRSMRQTISEIEDTQVLVLETINDLIAHLNQQKNAFLMLNQVMPDAIKKHFAQSYVTLEKLRGKVYATEKTKRHMLSWLMLTVNILSIAMYGAGIVTGIGALWLGLNAKKQLPRYQKLLAFRTIAANNGQGVFPHRSNPAENATLIQKEEKIDKAQKSKRYPLDKRYEIFVQDILDSIDLRIEELKRFFSIMFNANNSRTRIVNIPTRASNMFTSLYYHPETTQPTSSSSSSNSNSMDPYNQWPPQKP